MSAKCNKQTAAELEVCCALAVTVEARPGFLRYLKRTNQLPSAQLAILAEVLSKPTCHFCDKANSGFLTRFFTDVDGSFVSPERATFQPVCKDCSDDVNYGSNRAQVVERLGLTIHGRPALEGKVDYESL